MRISPTLLLVFLAPIAGGQGMPPAIVEVALVEELEFHEQLTLVGRTEARRESRIVAEIAGRVESIDALEGRAVKRGAALVTIDCRRIALALEAKQAESAQAAADAKLALKELSRARELISTQVVPERALDAAEADERRTAERFRQLEAERKRLALDLDDCSIRAPYDGHTVRKLVDVGEWVDAGTAVYEMVDLRIVKVTADLPERRFGEVQIGSTVTITAAQSGDSPLTGKITGIAPNASRATHTFPVIIEVDNADGRLGGGMLVRASLALNESFTGFAVPKDAIVRQAGQTIVFMVADGVASALPVTTGTGSGDLVAIEGEGLHAGLEVIVRGNERIFPGSPVTVATEDSTRTAAPGATEKEGT